MPLVVNDEDVEEIDLPFSAHDDRCLIIARAIYACVCHWRRGDTIFKGHPVLYVQDELAMLMCLSGLIISLSAKEYRFQW